MRRFDEGTIAALGASTATKIGAHYKPRLKTLLLIEDGQGYAGLDQKFELRNLF
jgi:hypothetical protein